MKPPFFLWLSIKSHKTNFAHPSTIPAAVVLGGCQQRQSASQAVPREDQFPIAGHRMEETYWTGLRQKPTARRVEMGVHSHGISWDFMGFFIGSHGLKGISWVSLGISIVTEDPPSSLDGVFQGRSSPKKWTRCWGAPISGNLFIQNSWHLVFGSSDLLLVANWDEVIYFC